MNKPADALATVVEELVSERAPDPAPCPDADELIAYHAGRLPAAEEARMRDHLVACPEDRALLVDLDRLASGELGSDRDVSEFELAAARKELKRRITAHESSESRPGAHAARSGRWFQVAAACLAVAALGLSGWAFDLRHSLMETHRPQLNAVYEDLYPGALRGGEGTVAVLTLSPADRLFTLNLNPARRDPADKLDDEYAVDVVRGDGQPVWSAPRVSRNRFGSISLTLSRQMFGSGEYRLRLYSTDALRDEPAFEFALRIEEASDER